MLSIRIILIVIVTFHFSVVGSAADSWQRVSLEGTPQTVAPMTGIVLWDDNDKTRGNITNLGVAPIYYDAYPAIVQSGTEVRSTVSIQHMDHCCILL